jgi:hypothetical protein
MTSSGKPQLMAVCDNCTEARRCLLRRMMAIERPHLPDPERYDAFIPDGVRR